jgi:hypothetical protein
MLSVEIIEHLRKEEEARRRREEAPYLPLPDQALLPEEEGQAREETVRGIVIELSMSQDDVAEFRVASW